MGLYRVGDLEFKVKNTGSHGPLVFLFHGYGSGPLEWHQVLPTLSQKHRVVSPNLSPLFLSSKPLTFSRQVLVLAQLMNLLNERRESFALVGSSYGSTLSFALRAHFKGLVEHHVLINPMPLNPSAHLKDLSLRMLLGMNMIPGALPLYLNSRLGQQRLESLGEIFGFGQGHKKNLTSLSPKKLELVSRALQRFAWIVQNEDWEFWRRQLSDHMIPTLLISGQKDPLFSEADFRSYQTLVPMSEYHGVDHADHLLVKKQGVKVANIIQDFINDEPRGDRDFLREELWRRAV